MKFTSDKYIIVTIDDNYVLTRKGFKKISELNQSTIRLFNHSYNANSFLDNHKGYNKNKYYTRKVKVIYEVV